MQGALLSMTMSLDFRPTSQNPHFKCKDWLDRKDSLQHENSGSDNFTEHLGLEKTTQGLASPTRVEEYLCFLKQICFTLMLCQQCHETQIGVLELPRVSVLHSRMACMHMVCVTRAVYIRHSSPGAFIAGLRSKSRSNLPVSTRLLSIYPNSCPYIALMLPHMPLPPRPLPDPAPRLHSAPPFEASSPTLPLLPPALQSKP